MRLEQLDVAANEADGDGQAGDRSSNVPSIVNDLQRSWSKKKGEFRGKSKAQAMVESQEPLRGLAVKRTDVGTFDGEELGDDEEKRLRLEGEDGGVEGKREGRKGGKYLQRPMSRPKKVVGGPNAGGERPGRSRTLQRRYLQTGRCSSQPKVHTY
jgi:hypothetical protein